MGAAEQIVASAAVRIVIVVNIIFRISVLVRVINDMALVVSSAGESTSLYCEFPVVVLMMFGCIM